MTVKELTQKLAELPADMPVVLCDLSYDGDGDGEVRLPEIKSVDVSPAINIEDGLIECVFINFEGRM